MTTETAPDDFFNTPDEYSPYVYRATVVKIVDADTVDVRIDLGLKISTIQRLRLYGINAWETRGEEREKGLFAKRWLSERLALCRESWALSDAADIMMIETIKDTSGKYGRYLAKIWVEGSLVNQELVDFGHARYADYKKRK